MRRSSKGGMPMICISDIKKARNKIADRIHETPILTSAQMNGICRNSMFFKAEHLQKTGSFKIRGATNKVLQAVSGGARMVTAASSGNHGQAVAFIAGKLGIRSTIVVPEDANKSKVAAIKEYGGEVEFCGTTSSERLPRAKEIAAEQGDVFIPPYDDRAIMAGQGTVGLEILEQVSEIDAIIVPVGGGGLLSGVLTAVKETSPAVQVFGVEPEKANDTFLSLKEGHITSITNAPTIADGLRTSQPGDVTFPIVQRYVDDIVLVTEEEIREAQLLIMQRMKQVVEPSSAVTLAAVLNGKLPLEAKRVVCILSGGNVDI